MLIFGLCFFLYFLKLSGTVGFPTIKLYVMLILFKSMSVFWSFSCCQMLWYLYVFFVFYFLGYYCHLFYFKFLFADLDDFIATYFTDNGLCWDRNVLRKKLIKMSNKQLLLLNDRRVWKFRCSGRMEIIIRRTYVTYCHLLSSYCHFA